MKKKIFIIISICLCVIISVLFIFTMKKNSEKKGENLVYARIDQLSYDSFVDKNFYIKNNLNLFKNKLKYFGYKNVINNNIENCLEIILETGEIINFIEGGRIEIKKIYSEKDDEILTMTIFPYFADSYDLKNELNKNIRRVEMKLENINSKFSIIEGYKMEYFLNYISYPDQIYLNNTGFIERHVESDIVFKMYNQCLILETILEFLYDEYSLEQRFK